MAEKISADEMRDVAATSLFNQSIIVKDYYVTLIIYLLKDVKGIYFKGGTALQKIFLDYSRLSEDADYTVTRNIEAVKTEIEDIIIRSGRFTEISKDKHVTDFVRLVVEYKDPFGETGSTFIDLNKRAKLVLDNEIHDIPHFYPDLPKFSVNTLAQKEMIAEKIAAAIGRNKPRDHFDIYRIIKSGLEIDSALVKKKCQLSGNDFNVIRMFNKAKKLKRRWDEDMLPLLREEVSFQKVMKTLSGHFKYAEAKEKLRKGGKLP